MTQYQGSKGHSATSDVFTCINTCEDTADVSSRDLWFECLDNVVVRLLASDWIGPSISLLEDYLRVIETHNRARNKRDQESRLKLMTGNCPTIFTGKISLLLSFLCLGFFVELSVDLLIASGINLGHVIVKRPCGMGKCCVGIAGRNPVNSLSAKSVLAGKKLVATYSIST